MKYRALNSLKYFCDEAPEYHLIAAGSFLGIAMHENESFPVGKTESLTIYPMTFAEFLEALGEKQSLEAIDKRRERLFEKHKRVLSASRKNMKRLMTEEQGLLFRKRSIIEIVWDVLKERYGLVYHLACNMTGLFRHYCYSLLSRMLQPFLYSCQLSYPPLSIPIDLKCLNTRISAY
ncbi:MAG: AAA family ATPase [Treponema sp.]|jgi:hypothetical protein|nr:AAA family ATPase [Treponema sp.]